MEGAVAARVDGDQVRLTTDVGDVALPLVRVEGDVALAALPAAERAGAAGFAVARPFTTSASPAPPGFHPMSGAADLRYGTFLGGSDLDAGYALTVHAAGYVYVAGATKSADFPTTPGAFDTALSGTSDAFVAKLDLTNNRLAYAICIGGGSTDVAEAIAVDATGNVYVAVLTASSDFPTTPSVFDDTHNGSNDAFVVKLNAYGSALHYATYLGGSSLDQGQSIAVDAAGKAYVVGSAASSNFPTTMGAYDTSYNGGGDIFVVEFATGTYRVYLPVVTR